MRVVQVAASLAREASGPSYSVRRLAESLAARGTVSEIVSLGEPAEIRRAGVLAHAVAQDLARVPLASRLGVSRAMRAALDSAAAGGAVLHTHGLWLMPNVYPAWSIARHGGALVISPRGMLGPAALRFSRHRKMAFWKLLQCRAVARAWCLHATSEQERQEIHAFGVTRPVALVPNGIDVASERDIVANRAVIDAGVPRTLLHLGRIHPKKGIDSLIEAWARVAPRHPNWRLRIVGPSEIGHGEALRLQAAARGAQRITFEDGLYGADKLAAYRQADLFVLPTLNENFGLVVAEALANGTPVISTRGAPWRGLEENRCGWWIDHGADPLAATLDQAMAMPRDTLHEMGARGRNWMAAEFSWDRVAADMERVYRWCAGGERPDDLLGAA